MNFLSVKVTKNLYSCHFNDLVIKNPHFWSYDTFWSKTVSQNGIQIFFYSIVVDKNTLRTMSRGSMTSTVFVWSNTPDNDRRLCYPFTGYYCPPESRNAIILHLSGQVFFPWQCLLQILTTLWWNLCCFDWQVSQLIIWVTEWLTQWMFGFWFCIMLHF